MAKKSEESKKKPEAALGSRKICNGCGAENAKNARKCSECGKDKFAPNWVLAKRPITRQSSVQITRSNPRFGNSSDRITLSKWWQGGRATYHISKPAQWEQIVRIINDDLAPLLGWKTEKKLLAEIAEHTDTRRTPEQIVADYEAKIASVRSTRLREGGPPVPRGSRVPRRHPLREWSDLPLTASLGPVILALSCRDVLQWSHG